MRRVLLFALSALLLLPGVAAAKTSKKADRSPAEVEAYWTVDRMKNAKPIERAKPVNNAKKPGTSTSGFTSREANPYDSAAGKLFFTDAGVNYVCSGTAITGDVVWTAGHCTHGGAGGAFAYNHMFVPAYKNAAEPYGRFAATEVHTTSGWQNRTEYGEDLGALTVTGLDAKVAERSLAIGGARYANGSYGSYTSHGYPAGTPFNGQLQWTCAATVTQLDSSPTPDTYALPCDMTGGSSGGGWYGSDGRVYSVNSYGYRTVRDRMFGPQQGTAASALYAAAN